MSEKWILWTGLRWIRIGSHKNTDNPMGSLEASKILIHCGTSNTLPWEAFTNYFRIPMVTQQWIQAWLPMKYWKGFGMKGPWSLNIFFTSQERNRLEKLTKATKKSPESGQLVPRLRFKQGISQVRNRNGNHHSAMFNAAPHSYLKVMSDSTRLAIIQQS